MASKKPSSKNSRHLKKAVKTVRRQKGFLARIDSFWRKESNVLAWAAAGLILLLFLNGIVLANRIYDASAKEAVKTPIANANVAIMQFAWFDNLPPAPQMYQPNKNYEIVGVRVQMLNLRSVNIWLAPSIESYITDSGGDRYGMAITELNHPFTAGSYSPQKVASGELSYAIPKNIEDPKWCYKLASSNGGGVALCLALNKYSKTSY